MTNTDRSVKNLVVAALMLALAYVLPNFTGNIPQIGSMLLPMHLPVLLCGFLCGGVWGAVVGFVAPLLRSVLVGVPPMFPTAISMACPRAWAASMPPSSAPCLPGAWCGALSGPC